MVRRAVEGYLLYRAATLMPLSQIEEWSAAGYPFFACLADRDQLMRILVRQRAQEDMIDHGKHRGGCAEAEGEGCYHRGGEDG